MCKLTIRNDSWPIHKTSNEQRNNAPKEEKNEIIFFSVS